MRCLTNLNLNWYNRYDPKCIKNQKTKKMQLSFFTTLQIKRIPILSVSGSMYVHLDWWNWRGIKSQDKNYWFCAYKTFRWVNFVTFVYCYNLTTVKLGIKELFGHHTDKVYLMKNLGYFLESILLLTKNISLIDPVTITWNSLYVHLFSYKC